MYPGNGVKRSASFGVMFPNTSKLWDCPHRQDAWTTLPHTKPRPPLMKVEWRERNQLDALLDLIVAICPGGTNDLLGQRVRQCPRTWSLSFGTQLNEWAMAMNIAAARWGYAIPNSCSKTADKNKACHLSAQLYHRRVDRQGHHRGNI
jgi:hypothetical protein